MRSNFNLACLAIDSQEFVTCIIGNEFVCVYVLCKFLKMSQFLVIMMLSANWVWGLSREIEIGFTSQVRNYKLLGIAIATV